MGFGNEPEIQGLLRSSFRLLAGDSVSGEHILKMKRSIANKYLILLPKHGTVILRINKAEFEAAVKTLKVEVLNLQERLKECLQTIIDENREKLVRALRAGVLANPPERWKRMLGSSPSADRIEGVLRSELTEAFGSTADLLCDMGVKAVFKGVTYESLNDPSFIAALEKVLPPVLGPLHHEFDAAPAGSSNVVGRP